MAVEAFPAWSRILDSSFGWRHFENDRRYAQSFDALKSTNYLFEEITCIARYGQFFTHAVIWLRDWELIDNPEESDFALLGALETHCFRLKSLVIYHPPDLSSSFIIRSAVPYIQPLQRMLSFSPSLQVSLYRLLYFSEETRTGASKLLHFYHDHNVLHKVACLDFSHGVKLTSSVRPMNCLVYCTSLRVLKCPIQYLNTLILQQLVEFSLQELYLINDEHTLHLNYVEGSAIHWHALQLIPGRKLKAGFHTGLNQILVHYVFKTRPVDLCPNPYACSLYMVTKVCANCAAKPHHVSMFTDHGVETDKLIVILTSSNLCLCLSSDSLCSSVAVKIQQERVCEGSGEMSAMNEKEISDGHQRVVDIDVKKGVIDVRNLREEIRDLLSKDQSKRLELKERPDTGVYVKDLSSFVTKSVREIEHVMNVGNQNRSVGATNMNEHSSRSHAIFIITVECSEVGADGENHIRVGKLNMVDLAGSERQAKTGATGDRFKEATKINLSLSALSNVISALVDVKTTHVPYRDSKLTRLLQDSLGGNSKTVMVANIGPAGYNYDETLTTLRYASRAKNIKNKPRINEDPKDALLREFQEEINRLKNQLAERGGPKKKKKRRSRRTRDGQIIEDDEDDDEGDEEDEGLFMQEQMTRLEEQKKAILNNQSLIAEEKEQLLGELQEKESRLAKEKEQRDQLAMKIKAMESKLLMGGKNIVDHTNEQQRALEQKRQELLEQARKEREIQQKLEEKEESAVEIKETYNSLQQEVEVKTKKLKKLFGKLQATKAEIQDLQEEHTKERQELEQTLMELTRELKLKYLIIENFIPPEEKTKLMNRAVYDEDADTWMLRPLANKNTQTMAKRPVSALGNKRPVSEFARKVGAMGGNPRFKGENILCVELDMPNRTTRDYEGPTVAPRVQAALDAALQDEDDIDIDGGAAVIMGKAKAKKKAARVLVFAAPSSFTG
ncbi:hypothetical protein C0Q70_04454 [Pomacea canaliculata]|uniref:Kinesin-like protein n=1 Tax=Pomacea canaliculata TaxID=400727 RepID=A0A2T7PIF4_POMCA|nr:hypothetical protein C0Q70_04454 [Pomacea canaliculata]